MKKDSYKVTVKVGDATVQVQGAQTGVVKIVEALADVLRGSRRPSASVPGTSPAGVSGPARGTPTDIRSFFTERQPSSDVEAAAVAAYFYEYVAPREHRRETIDANSLQEAFRLAKWPLPKRTVYTLVNARNSGYLDSVGEGGQYKLNPVGYNLVEHTLGRAEPTEKAKKAKRKPKRKRRG